MPANSTSRPSASSKTRRSTGSSAPPEVSSTKSANSAANSSSFGRSEPATSRWRSGRPMRIRPCGPSSRVRWSTTSGSRIRAASQPSPVSELTSRRSPEISSVHGAEADHRQKVAHGRVLQLGRADPPCPEVVAADDHVERPGVEGVHDRQPGRTLVDERLGVAPAVGRGGHQVERGDRLALGSDRPERGIDEALGVLPVVLGRVGDRGAALGRRDVAADRAPSRRSARGSPAPHRGSPAAARRRSRARRRGRRRCPPGPVRRDPAPSRPPRQRPFQVGVRFSLKAAIPSRWSSLAKRR